MDARNPVNVIMPPAALFGLEQRLLARWRRRPLLPSERLIVGFSGGTDSLALATALGRIAERAELRAILAHIDHRQRASSRAEAAQAAALAARLGLPFSTRHIPDDCLERHRGLGVEEALRR
ncbi:MAG TPA: ATP-binding protein, partial [Thermomicrobiales bacterium]|nr:ATP-binding protein [Thermomicrobiales bacterium]